MGDKFAKVIISIVIILIIVVTILFGKIILDEIDFKAAFSEAEVFVSDNLDNEPYPGEVSNGASVEIADDTVFDNINDGQSNITNRNDNTNAVGYRYFYNQLETTSKTIYDAFYTHKEDMMSGTYRLSFGNEFANILNQADGQATLGALYQSALEAFNYDNPEVFYINPNKMYLSIETKTLGNTKTYDVYIDMGNGANYLGDEFTGKEQVEQAARNVQQIKNEVLQNKKNSDYENIKYIHDYLVENVEYDTSVAKNNIYDIYGTLIYKQAVCEGYARSFKYFMDALNIPCTLVIGQGTNSIGQTENHAWNYVQVDGTWYAIDPTWDDPVSTTGYVSQASKSKYFLKGLSEFSKDHTPTGQFTEGGKVFTYPNVSQSNYE